MRRAARRSARQYAHLDVALASWDAWTPVAAQPVAFEPPSASFVLDWSGIKALRLRGVADQRIGAHTRLRIVDAILTGTHEPGASHHELLRAFASDDTLAAAGVILAEYGYRTHEFGDSMLVERA